MNTDGSYGWVVVWATFAATLLEFGTFKSFSIFLTPVHESLDCPVTVVGTVFAMVQTICYLMVPLTGKATTYYGCRCFVVAGGAFNFAGLLVSSVSTSIGPFAVGMTLLGIGFGLSYTPLVITVFMYFPTRFALANGVLTSGAAIGMMVIPPLAELLIATYGWPWAMALLAAVNFNVCACGALVRPPSAIYRKLRGVQDDEDPSGVSNTTQLTFRDRVFAFLKDIPEKLSLDIVVLAPMYNIYLLLWFLNGLVYSAWLIYLIPHAISRGIDSSWAGFLATAGGIGNLVVRVVHGPAIDRGYITAVRLFILLTVMNAIAFYVDLVSYDFYSVLAILALINGAGLGTIGIILMPVAQEVLSEADLSLKGYMLSLPFFALGETCGGAIAGVFYEVTGNYDTAFFFLGVISTCIVVVLITERTFASWSKRGR
ncbi:monocarboxylate transporter 12-like [Patiria miniata]|uniref:Major facilitator superfamily (MFS) profile domain-containing protein n=1 Tax=Patiria miniata TaxID=46514 RepID=A0A914BBM2_PATMI|nr:monocarboxylate transporter 12-like [Patiria miniata]